jgi:hypothetical protein
MTADERAEMERLCRLIAVEKDQTKFIALVRQLNELLEHKGNRFKNQQSSTKAN